MTEFTIHWCDIPMGRVRVRTAGNGPSVMFVHGALVDGRIWDSVATRVAEQGFTVVLPDLPLGAHTVPVADRTKLSPSSVAECLFDIADRLGIERFALVGFDTGGAISQIATALHPELVRAWAEPCRTNPEVRADCVAAIRAASPADTLAAAEKLKTFHGPSMVMWSREDQIFPVKDAHRLAALLPRCELRWIDDSFTFASLDNPERLTELVLEFMALP